MAIIVFLSKTSTESTTISFPGYVGFQFDMSLNNSIVLSPGYSLYVIQGDGLDLGYGFDLALKYFPFTDSSVRRVGSENDEWTTSPFWRPYFMTGFEQRQFQSIQSNYAGLMLGAGTHYQMFDEDYLFGEFSYTYLSGPSSSSINEFRFELDTVLALSNCPNFIRKV